MTVIENTDGSGSGALDKAALRRKYAEERGKRLVLGLHDGPPRIHPSVRAELCHEDRPHHPAMPALNAM